MADLNIHWHDWAKERSDKAKKEREKRTSIRWDLPKHIPQPFQKTIILFGSSCKQWFIEGEKKPLSFIYLLENIESKQIKYVGSTNEPERRYKEHKRKKTIRGDFYMRIVDIGNYSLEQQWMNKLLLEGHSLENSRAADAATKSVKTSRTRPPAF